MNFTNLTLTTTSIASSTGSTKNVPNGGKIFFSITFIVICLLAGWLCYRAINSKKNKNSSEITQQQQQQKQPYVHQIPQEYFIAKKTSQRSQLQNNNYNPPVTNHSARTSSIVKVTGPSFSLSTESNWTDVRSTSPGASPRGDNNSVTFDQFNTVNTTQTTHVEKIVQEDKGYGSANMSKQITMIKNNKENETEDGKERVISVDDKLMTKVVGQASDVSFAKNLHRQRIQGICVISGTFFLGLGSFVVIWGLNSDNIYEYSFLISVSFFSIQTLYLLNATYWYYIEQKMKIARQHRRFRCCYATKIIRSQVNIIMPVVTHFADYATDIAVLIEFYGYYQDSQNDEESQYGWQEYLVNINDTDDVNGIIIDYASLFIVSVFIMTFYKFVTGFVIWYLTKSCGNAFLQFLDIYIYKVIKVSIEAGLTKPSPVQLLMRLLETLFELSV